MDINGETADFEQILENDFCRRYDACRKLLRANGIQHDVETIRRVIRNLHDRGASPEECHGKRLRAQQELVKYILSYNKPLVCSGLTSGEINEFLLDACFASSSDPLFGEIRNLIEHGADVKARDEDGISAFMHLMTKGHGDLLRLFLERGADANETIFSEGRPWKTVWLNSIRWLGSEDLRLMLKHGARINDTAPGGCTALMEYCDGSPKPEGIRLLLERGADPIPADERGNSALHRIARNVGAAKMMKLLIDRGADVNLQNGEGNSPLHLVADSRGCGDEHGAACLLERGANPNLVNAGGDTPLMLAVSSDKQKVVEVLMRHGANRELRDVSGRTAYEIALSKGSIETAGIIRPESDAGQEYDSSPEAAQVKRMRGEIIEKLKAGHTFATGNREGNDILYWVSPTYRIDSEDLGGSRSSTIATDEEVLEHVYLSQKKSWEKQTEVSVYEEVIQIMMRSPKRAVLPTVSAQEPQQDWSGRFERYKEIYTFARPAIRTEEDMQRALKALDALYAHQFGYSDRHIAMQAVVPTVFEIVQRHIRTLDDLLLLCAELPRIIRNLPEDNDDSPVGKLYRYDLSALRARGLVALTMKEFASPGPLVVGSSSF